MSCRIVVFALTMAALLSGSCIAGDSDDLSRIPASADQPQPVDASAPSANQKLYLQDDLSANFYRNQLVVPLAQQNADWEERLFFDARSQWELTDSLYVTYSGRLNLRYETGVGFPSREDVRLDSREGYVTWDFSGDTFFEIGRVNIKSGVALGYNPTDYFKTRAVVETLSADPSVLREDRLGTAVILGQHVWKGGSLLIAIAPKLANETPIYSDTNLPNLNPMFDRTNANTRILVKTSMALSDTLSPEFLYYHEAGIDRFGANMTYAVGQALVAYLEWSAGKQETLAEESLQYGVDTRTLPSGAVGDFSQGGGSPVRSDVAGGISYSTPYGLTLNLEYLYHGAGFSGHDWRNWFLTGQSQSSSPLVTGELWYIRSYASDRQDPTARQATFLRASWQDAFIRKLDITGFAITNLHDGSNFIQISADYNLGQDWTLGALLDVTEGGRRSEYGSLPGRDNALVTVARYF